MGGIVWQYRDQLTRRHGTKAPTAVAVPIRIEWMRYWRQRVVGRSPDRPTLSSRGQPAHPKLAQLFLWRTPLSLLGSRLYGPSNLGQPPSQPRHQHHVPPNNQPHSNRPPHPQFPHQKAHNAEKRHPVDQLPPNPAFSFPCCGAVSRPPHSPRRVPQPGKPTLLLTKTKSPPPAFNTSANTLSNPP